MRNKLLIAGAIVGILAGMGAAWVFGLTKPPLAPVFQPLSDPYANGIYAEGMIESVQASGENLSVYPEVPGTIRSVLVTEGELVRKGQPLFQIDDAVQRAATAQQQSAAEAARAVLDELRAEPRRETLDVAEAQVVAAEAALKTAEDVFGKAQAAYQADRRSISVNDLDAARDAVGTARANLDVSRRQRDLTKAGAWSFDVRSQQRQYAALDRSFRSSSALLAKYTVRAPEDGVVLSINTVAGAFVSSLGTYDSYTQGMMPVMVLGGSQAALQVRCYVDEILIPKLPVPSKIKAQMSIRGSDVTVPLEYVRMQPLVSPKIELSDQRQERVDLRVLPVIFRMAKPTTVSLYPGELVDVYIGQ
jgi:HlyD family secretion protein